MRILAFLLLTLVACATAPQPKPDLAPRPVRVLHRLVQGRLPRLQLRELALGASMDFLMHQNAPSGSGQIPCSSSSTSAAWLSPAACGLATGTNYWTLSTNTLNAASGWSLSLNAAVDAAGDIGWSAYPATSTNLLRYTFGDNWSGMQSGSNDRMQIYAYHGIEVRGGRASLSTPSNVAGGSAADPSLIVTSSAIGGGLRIDTNSGTAGTAISFSGRTTWTNPGTSFTGPGCADSLLHALTGAATGAECIMGTGGASMGSMQCSCYVPSAGNIAMHCCSPSTGTVTLPNGTYSFRVFNP